VVRSLHLHEDILRLIYIMYIVEQLKYEIEVSSKHCKRVSALRKSGRVEFREGERIVEVEIG
jgi:hypothetical protein